MTENQSSLVQLFKEVREYFATHAPKYSVVFGARERWRQLNQGTDGTNRVVVIPGRIPNGEDGPLDGADGPGESIDVTRDEDEDSETFGEVLDVSGNPRPLYRQDRILTFSLWAANNTSRDPQSQDEAELEEIISQLFEYTIRAVKLSPVGAADHQWGACRYNRNPEELRNGIEYLAELAVGEVWLDAVPRVIVPTAAEVTRGEITS